MRKLDLMIQRTQAEIETHTRNLCGKIGDTKKDLHEELALKIQGT
jgi:hypothetical protein